jgi:hypothetical protein
MTTHINFKFRKVIKQTACREEKVQKSTLCKYVSDVLGKSKLMTTLTAWISIPLVNRSATKRAMTLL